jgi:hypothetical protein
MPDEGNQRSEKEKTDRTSMPTKKSGAARVINASKMPVPSRKVPRRQARIAPPTTPKA